MDYLSKSIKWAALLFILFSLNIHPVPAPISIGGYTGFTFYQKTDTARILQLEKELEQAKGTIKEYEQLVMSFPASHGHGEVVKPPDTAQPNEMWYQYPRHVRGSSMGDYIADEWLINLIRTEGIDGKVSYLTDEPGVTFSVREAVKSKSNTPWIRYGVSGSYDGNKQVGAFGDVMLWNHVSMSAGYRTDNTYQVKGGWMW